MPTLRRALIVVSISIWALAAAPTAHAITLAAVMQTVPRTVVTFDSATPQVYQTNVPLTGVDPAENIIGIDRSPRDGVVYMITNAAMVARLYRLDPLSGVATLVAPLTADPLDPTSPWAGNGGTAGDFDINPVTGVGRVIMLGDRPNFRVDLATGRVITDAHIIGANNYTALAHSNNVASAGSTTVFLVNYTTDNINQFTDAEAATIGGLGPNGHVGENLVSGLEFAPNGVLYQVIKVAGVVGLYTTSSVNGAATLVAPIGGGVTYTGDFTSLANVVTVDTPAAAANEGGSATVRLTRSLPFGATRIDWTATAGTAAADDFVGSGSVTFPAGVTTVDALIPITDDFASESSEGFSVTFAASRAADAPDGVAHLRGNAVSTVTIGASDPDLTKPFLYLLQPPAAKYKVFLKNGAALSLFTSEQISGTVTYKLGAKTIATGTIASTKPALVTKRFKLTKAGAKLLAKAKGKRLKIVATIAVKDPAGNASTVKRTLLVLR